MCTHIQENIFIDSYTKFCTNCGNQIKNQTTNKLCPICNKTYEDGEKYCTSCGTPKYIYSPFIVKRESDKKNPLKGVRPNFYNITQYQRCCNCDSPNPYEAKYCRECGKDITLSAKDQFGHGWVDLGLSVLWSTQSIGGYYIWNNNKFFSEKSGKENHCEDIATMQWGNKWRTPTKEEFEELVKKCKWEKCVIGNDLKDNALRVIGPNGNTMIIRTTGFEGGIFQGGSGYTHCCFWTSSKHPTKHNQAYAFWYEGSRPYSFPDKWNSIYPAPLSPKWRMTQNDGWLNNPVEMMVGDNYERRNTVRPASYHMLGLGIRPVVDIKWKGKM